MSVLPQQVQLWTAMRCNFKSAHGCDCLFWKPLYDLDRKYQVQVGLGVIFIPLP